MISKTFKHPKQNLHPESEVYKPRVPRDRIFADCESADWRAHVREYPILCKLYLLLDLSERLACRNNSILEKNKHSLSLVFTWEGALRKKNRYPWSTTDEYLILCCKTITYNKSMCLLLCYYYYYYTIIFTRSYEDGGVLECFGNLYYYLLPYVKEKH